MEEGIIRIHQKIPSYGTIRQMVVKIDRQRLGGVKNNSSSDFPVPPGWHRIEFSMDWAASPALEAFASAVQHTPFAVPDLSI